jgi:hypothetical protein
MFGGLRGLFVHVVLSSACLVIMFMHSSDLFDDVQALVNGPMNSRRLDDAIATGQTYLGNCSCRACDPACNLQATKYSVLQLMVEVRNDEDARKRALHVVNSLNEAVDNCERRIGTGSRVFYNLFSRNRPFWLHDTSGSHQVDRIYVNECCNNVRITLEAQSMFVTSRAKRLFVCWDGLFEKGGKQIGRWDE